MKKLFFYFLATLVILFSFSTQVLAQEEEATAGAEATASAEEATSGATLEKVVKEKTPEEKEKDITEPTPEVKGKLEKYLSEHSPGPLGVTNFLQHLILQAVKQGVPANTIVIVLLFPLVAAIIAASRHLIGIRGFGIFLQAVTSVVFVSTGLVDGLTLFLSILVVATGARVLLRKMKLQYLPRMALLLWFVSLGVLAALFLSPILNINTIMDLSIFPILILILLAERFIGIQIGKSMKEAVRMIFETLFVALVCSYVLQLEFLQKLVLVKPELSIISIAIFDIYVGKFTGLRLLEYKKFKKLLK